MTATQKTWIERAAFAAVVVFVLVEWHASHKALKDTETKIASTETQRKREVAQTTKKVEAIQHAVKAAKTPAQKLSEFNTLVPLPIPLSAPVGSLDQLQAGTRGGSSAAGSLPSAVVPKADVQPLLDYAAGCAECKLKLASDETQIKQLEGERDSALQTAKGGSFWQRTRKAVKYVAIGVAVGVTVGVVAAHK